MLVPPPADLPSRNPTTSYWQLPESPIANHRSTAALPKAADYVIVGGGITGASIAYRILEQLPESKVVLLEARAACSGASGRNGGHCRPGRYTTFARDEALYGTAEASKIARLEENNVQSVAAFAKKHRIDCDLESVTTVDLFEDESAFGETFEAVAARRAALAEDIRRGEVQGRRIWTSHDAGEQFKTPRAAGAITFDAFTLTPYGFTCGVLQLALRLGLNLQTHTPVLSVASATDVPPSQPPSWTVVTPRGKIQTRAVILATNGYTSHLLPQLSSFLTPVRNQCTAQRPGSRISATPDFLAQHSIGFVFPTSVPGVYGSDYMASKPARSSASTVSGRARTIIFGGGRFLSSTWERHCTDDSRLNRDISHYLSSALPDCHFGRENWGEGGGKVLREWTGIVGLTPDENPLVGEVPGKKGLWVCAGFNGHGMALAFRTAEALALMVTGTEASVEWLPLTFQLNRASVARVFGRKAQEQPRRQAECNQR